MTAKSVLHSESCSGCLVTQQDPELMAHRSGASHKLPQRSFHGWPQDMQASSSLIVDPAHPDFLLN